MKKPKPKARPSTSRYQAKSKKKTSRSTPEKVQKKAVASQKKTKEKSLGKIDHYFDKIGVAAMTLGDSLKVGDTIRIEGGSVAFAQQIASMQIDHESVNTAKKGDEVGFKVKQKVREGYRVFKV